MTDEIKSLAKISITPALTNEQHKEYMLQMKNFVKEEMIENADYGVIPGTSDKTLYDPGAEKLARRYNFAPKFEAMEEIQDFDKGFLFYKYKCIIIHAPTNTIIGEAVRSCNSKEKKYSQYSKPEKWARDDEKARVIGKKKNEKYNSFDLIIRKSPEEIAELANTILSMAQMRAFVEAVRTATMTSSIFKGADVNQSAEAPNKPVTKEEDPYRVNLINKLYGTITEHGLTNEGIHKAILKKWNLDSITKLSNLQIDELTEFIVITYIPVEKGQNPQFRIKKAIETPKEEKVQVASPIEETSEKEIEYFCKGKKHIPGQKETMVKTTIDKPWCTKECEESYYTGMKKNDRMAEFIKTGKIPAKEKKTAETAELYPAGTSPEGGVLVRF